MGSVLFYISYMKNNYTQHAIILNYANMDNN
jgi:hypothetical protein